MLEQMGEAGLALRLVLRPDIVPGADRDDRRLVVLVDQDGQAVVELERLVRDRDFADQRADRRRLGEDGRGGPGATAAVRSATAADSTRALGAQAASIEPEASRMVSLERLRMGGRLRMKGNLLAAP